VSQRDFILREIERLGAFMVALRNRLLGGEATASEVRGELDAFGRRAGLDIVMLRSLSADTLVTAVQGRAGADPATCWLWAEFLYLDGLAARADEDDAAAFDRFSKALVLYGLLRTPLTGGWLAEVPDRVKEIQDYLAE
jgi:hypothetical protein